MRGRETTPGASLARLGFADPTRAQSLLADPVMAGFTDPLDDYFGDGIPGALSQVADPDLALLTLVRLLEAVIARDDLDDESGASSGHLKAALRTAGPAQSRLLGVMGASTALGDHLVAHPDHWPSVADAGPMTAAQLRDRLVDAVTGLQTEAAYDALRASYRRELMSIAALDLTSPDPAESMPQTARALADLASAALEAALVIARDQVGDEADLVRLSVVGMGKCGGRELNYVSDVDVIFVCEPRPGARPDGGTVDDAAAATIGTQLASALMRACALNTPQGTLWPVDAALRPEGKQGPLVRTVASHKQYYERWAKTWEFQALLKARHVAGDAELSAAYLAVVEPMVWQAAGRENFVEDVQAMRRRVEHHVPAREADRQIKLGPGGLRDVEFSVQLLQLVHGRTDDRLRSRTTLEALAALAAGGYVGRDDAAVLDSAYRFLRSMEHRIQLYRLRRTHLMPTSQADLRRLGRSMGLTQDPEKAIGEAWAKRAREVRRLHERLFYRPLLSAVARLSSDQAQLSPEAARDLLSALGFRDPKGAMRHLQALTEGVSRTAAIQRTLMPVMLGWFADGADPDAGLLAFRRVSDELGSIHWYLKMLRDEGSAAQRLARVLSSGRFVSELLERTPTAVQILGEERGLLPRDRAAIQATMSAAASRKDSPDEAMAAIRAVRRTELIRIAVADLGHGLDLVGVGQALTDLTAATIGAALELAIARVEGDLAGPLGTRLLVVAMGRFGGAETGYGSDADVMFVHQRVPGESADDAELQRRATAAVTELRRLTGITAADPPIGLDADLRPEGKSGPLVRTLDSYRQYYDRWAQAWERQALLRATPVVGDDDLADAFLQVIDPFRYPAGGLDASALREIRKLKARMEAERLPRGADRRTHLKLGLGGLSDLEWTIQLLQLEHAHVVPGLRTTHTLDALAAAVSAGLIAQTDAAVLRDTWVSASRLRGAIMLWRGRPSDSIPADGRDVEGVCQTLGGAPGQGAQFMESHLRLARRSRRIVERLFYGESG